MQFRIIDILVEEEKKSINPYFYKYVNGLYRGYYIYNVDAAVTTIRKLRLLFATLRKPKIKVTLIGYQRDIHLTLKAFGNNYGFACLTGNVGKSMFPNLKQYVADNSRIIEKLKFDRQLGTQTDFVILFNGSRYEDIIYKCHDLDIPIIAFVDREAKNLHLTTYTVPLGTNPEMIVFFLSALFNGYKITAKKIQDSKTF